MAYTTGRAWIENLRIDTADHVLGLRLNVWTSLIVFAAAVVFFIISARTGPGQEDIRVTPATGDDTPGEALPADAPPVVEGTTPDTASSDDPVTESGDADRSESDKSLADEPKVDAATKPSADGSRD